MLQSIMQAPPSQANNDYQLGFVRPCRQVDTSPLQTSSQTLLESGGRGEGMFKVFALPIKEYVFLRLL